MTLDNMILEVSSALEDVTNREFSKQEIRDYLNDAQLDLAFSLPPAFLLNVFHEDVVAFIPTDSSVAIPTANIIRVIGLRVGASSINPERVVPIIPESELRAFVSKQTSFPTSINWIQSMVATIDGKTINLFHNGNTQGDTTANAFIASIIEPVHLYEGGDEPDIGGQWSALMIKYALAMCNLHEDDDALFVKNMKDYIQEKERMSIQNIEEAKASKEQVSQERIAFVGTSR